MIETSSIFTTFVIIFRETLEAGLIIGIIFTVLARLNHRKYFAAVFLSSVAAIGLSVITGCYLISLASSLQGELSQWIEGVASLFACAILTFVVFWMNNQSRKIKSGIENKISTAISRKEFYVIISLPFLAILREGAETVLFLSAVAAQNSNMISFWGGFSGFAAAAGLCYAVFVWGTKIPLKPLFRGSGFLLLMMAAGLLAYGVHELQEIGIIPELMAPVWNINHIINEKTGVGSFLKAIFGYNANPSLIEIISYTFYLTAIICALTRKPKVSYN